MKKSVLTAGWLFVLVMTGLLSCNKDKSGMSQQPDTVYMKNAVFSPASLQVSKITTITWINDDDMIHTVTADDASFDSGDIAPGSTFRYTFNSGGTYKYHCQRHTGMTGVVLVTGVR